MFYTCYYQVIIVSQSVLFPFQHSNTPQWISNSAALLIDRWDKSDSWIWFPAKGNFLLWYPYFSTCCSSVYKYILWNLHKQTIYINIYINIYFDNCHHYIPSILSLYRRCSHAEVPRVFHSFCESSCNVTFDVSKEVKKNTKQPQNNHKNNQHVPFTYRPIGHLHWSQ